jgi:glycosyltransferase involved in cell wall biosynthesis
MCSIDMKNISAVIITKNEEANIDRCLRSLAGIADEIIVIDSYSDDETESICRKYNINFIKKEFKDYSSSKNFGNSLANYSYILSIDADEALSEELRTSIKANKNNLTADGYFFNRKTNYYGQWINHCGWYPDTKLRLWKKEKGTWKGIVHEQLKYKGTNTKGLGGDLLHYSYPSIQSHVKKKISIQS